MISKAITSVSHHWQTVSLRVIACIAHVFHAFPAEKMASQPAGGGKRGNFMAVHSLTENTIEVCPEAWVSKDKKTASWPPYGRMRLIRAIEKEEEPQDTWKSYACRIFFSGGGLSHSRCYFIHEFSEWDGSPCVL